MVMVQMKAVFCRYMWMWHSARELFSKVRFLFFKKKKNFFFITCLLIWMIFDNLVHNFHSKFIELLCAFLSLMIILLYFSIVRQMCLYKIYLCDVAALDITNLRNL